MVLQYGVRTVCIPHRADFTSFPSSDISNHSLNVYCSFCEYSYGYTLCIMRYLRRYNKVRKNEKRNNEKGFAQFYWSYCVLYSAIFILFIGPKPKYATQVTKCIVSFPGHIFFQLIEILILLCTEGMRKGKYPLPS